MEDLYSRLGISKTASQAEIKSAYRKLAKRYHPDLNPGDRTAEQRFKEASQAYDILSDAEKRRQYDAGEINAEGQPRNPFGAGFRQRAHEAYNRQDFGFGSAEDVNAEDIFADLFGGAFGSGFGGRGRGAGRGRVRSRGADVSYEIRVSFLEAATGTSKRVRLADGKVLDVTIPAGTEDAQTLRLKGQGMAGMGGGAAGDAFVKVQVEDHPHFRRNGQDIDLTLPISLPEAVLGGSVQVPTIHGAVSMKIPAGSNSGRRLRLKGRGIKPRSGEPGDQYVTLEVVLPEKPDAELKRFVEDWAGKHPYDPRKGWFPGRR